VPRAITWQIEARITAKGARYLGIFVKMSYLIVFITFSYREFSRAARGRIVYPPPTHRKRISFSLDSARVLEK
jgi:hypothetical protein